MIDPADGLILTINCGSSSLKAALFRAGGAEALVARGQLDRIGLRGGRFRAEDDQGNSLTDRALDLPDHQAALHALFDWLRERHGGAVRAVGHRVVQGGPRYRAPQRVTPEMLAELRRLIPFDPMHLPAQIRAIEAVAERNPQLPQVACFDTAFHHTLPQEARLFALPRRYAEQGICRYGFHGLSYEYIVEELGKGRCDASGPERVIIAHLGNGASMAAVRCGTCIDTTMGLTPTGGLVMGTRSGDLDPGVLLYLLRQERLTPDQLAATVNDEGGMRGLSGVSSDMRELLQRAPSEPSAALAVEIFCYQARKFIGALTAALGGLDLLVFTAGIGERAPQVRETICARLDWLGVRLDVKRNAGNEEVISADDSRVRVQVMKTNEELMIARHTARVLAGQGA